MANLAAPIVRVTLEDGDNLSEYVVQTDNRDNVAWDMTRGRKKWPQFNEAPFLWLTFLAWSAMRRGGDTSLSVDDFLERCVSAQAVKQDGTAVSAEDAAAEDISVDPTNPAAVSD
jgi:hypothetical protein